MEPIKPLVRSSDVLMMSDATDKVIVRKVLNPFKPISETETTTQEPNQPLHTYLQMSDLPKGYDTVVSVSGQVTEDYTVLVRPGQTVGIAVIPQGGENNKALRTVAMIGLLAATYGVAGSAMFMGYTATGGAVGFAANVGLGLAYVGGSMLINHMLPDDVDVAPADSLESSSTYSWSATNAQGGGGKIGVLYGKMRITPQILGQYVISTGAAQNLNVLYALGEGTMSHISQTTTLINGISVSKYLGVSTTVTQGANNYGTSGADRFVSSRIDIPVGQELDWDTDTNSPVYAYSTATTGNLNDSIEAILSAPRGLYHLDGGDISNWEVPVTVEYKEEDAPDVSSNWHRMVQESSFGGNVEVGDSLDNAILTTGDWVEFTGGWAEQGVYWRDSDGEYDAGIYIPEGTIGRIVDVKVKSKYGMAAYAPTGKVQTHQFVTINSRIRCDINGVTSLCGSSGVPTKYFTSQFFYIGNTVGQGKSSVYVCTGSTDIGGHYNEFYTKKQDITHMIRRPSFDSIPNCGSVVDNQGQYMSGATSQAIRQRYIAADIDGGTYDTNGYAQPVLGKNYVIRAKRNVDYQRNEDDGTTMAEYAETINFEYATQVADEVFKYPNTATMVLKALATEKLSGNMPTVSVICTRGAIAVEGVADKVPSNNPAWACYDILTNTRYGAGIAPAQVDLTSFQDWAEYCDDEGFELNIYIDQEYTLANILKLVSSVGRAQVVQTGTMFSVVLDNPKAVAQSFMFGMGNIVDGSFEQSFVPLQERANILELTYYDASIDYEEYTIQLSQDGYDTTRLGDHRKQLTLFGITNKDQAVRYGKYLLNQNRYLTQTASWEADIEALVCNIGDVVKVSHDIPQWGFSGRIVREVIDWDTSPVYEDEVYEDLVWDSDQYVAALYLDQDITYERGVEHVFQVKHNVDDKIDSCIVYSPGEGTVTTNVIPTCIRTGVRADDVYSFGPVNKNEKLFKIMSISRETDFKRKISALEYVPEVYDDTVTVDDVTAPSVSDEVQNLTFDVVYYQDQAGLLKSAINLSWTGVALYWNVSYRNTTVNSFTDLGTVTAPLYQIRDLGAGTYVVLVNDYSVVVEVAGTPTMNPDWIPTNLAASIENTSIVLRWEPPNISTEVRGYALHMTVDGGPTQVLASKIEGLTFTYSEAMVAGSEYAFYISAVDAYNNVSSTQLIDTFSVVAHDILGLNYSIDGGDLTLEWKVPTGGNIPIDYYTIKILNEYDEVLKEVKSKVTTIAVPVSWHGTLYAQVSTVNMLGVESVSAEVTVPIVPPKVSNLTAAVIDNNVLLRWETTKGTLPLADCSIYNAVDGTLIGEKKGTFTSVFELNSGVFEYQVVVQDTASEVNPDLLSIDYVGKSAVVAAEVNEPPDYVLNQDWGSDFSGTIMNGVLDGRGGIFFSLAAEETYEEHFQSRGWLSPQNQIDGVTTSGTFIGYPESWLYPSDSEYPRDGADTLAKQYPIWSSPFEAYGYYEETFDYGGIVPPSTLTVNTTVEQPTDGTDPVDIQRRIWVSNDGIDWDAVSSDVKQFVSDVRYVRVRILFNGTERSYATLRKLQVKLDSKIIRDSGSVRMDSAGTPVTFNKTFADVTSLNVTPAGTAMRTAIVDYEDVHNPTGFSVYLFDNAGGYVTDGSIVYWEATGY